MKAKKRFLSILLSFALLLGLMPGISLTAYAEETKVGSATYTINDGVLTVGSGSFTKEEWRAIFLTTSSNGTPTGATDIAKTITKVVFEQGVTATNNATAGMFFGWTALKEADLSKLNTSGVTDMWSMFKGCTKLETVDLSGLNTTSVTYMDEMFSGCQSLQALNVRNFDTSKVTTMKSMFATCSSLKTLDLSSFNTQNCSNFSYMFNGCSQLTTITVGENWTTAKQKNWSQMFEGCTNLVGGNGTTYVSGKGKEYAIIDGTDGKPGFMTGSVQVHTHNFSYTANEAVITATCTSTIGVCGLTDNKVTLTLKAPAIKTYGMGQNEKAILEGTAAFNEATGKAISEENIEYYKGETKLDAAPKDAGSYTAKITVEGQTVTVSYTIQKGNNTIGVGKPQVESKTETSITLKSTEGYEYKCGEGEWQTSNVFTGLTAGTSYTFYQRIAETDNLKPSTTSGGTEVSTNPHIHAHDFEYSLSQDGKTITATCKKTDPGHTGADSATLTINTPKLLVVPETRDVGSTGMSIISPNYAAELTGLQVFKDFTGLDIRPIQIKYYKVEGETETAIDNYPHEAGTYRAKITAGEKTASVEYTISKIDLTADKFTYTAPENLVYNGEAKTATVTSKKEGVGEVTVEYWNAQGQKLDGVPVNAGSYTVKISVPESTRYNSAEHLTADEWTFTITTGNATVITAPTAKTLTYNGSAQALVTAGEATGGTMKYAVTTTNVAPADTLYTTSIPTGTDAGTYYVWYKVVGDANHNDTEPTGPITVTISQKADPSGGGGGDSVTDPVQQVVDMINTLPVPVSEKDADAVKAARDVYDKLTDEQKKDSRLTDEVMMKLTDAEAAIEAAKQKAAAKAFDDVVAGMPADVSEWTREQLNAALAAYNNLTDAQKALVDPAALAKMQNAEFNFASADARAKKVKLIFAKSKKGKKAQAKWTKNSKVTGYQLVYSTSRKFTKKTTKKSNIKRNKTIKKTIGKLKKGKTYYFRVRPYTKVYNGVTKKKVIVYGKWSNVKKCKAKK